MTSGPFCNKVNYGLPAPFCSKDFLVVIPRSFFSLSGYEMFTWLKEICVTERYRPALLGHIPLTAVE